ncbi:MAG: agmatinase [bacterium]|nr:agmatinase [bacterium]
MNTTPKNFCGLTEEFSNYSKAKIVVLPIPFDETSTWGKGADKGPAAIIEASRNMEIYDIETKSEVYKEGIFTAKPITTKNSEQMVKEGYDQTKQFLNDKKFVVTLGGEHSVPHGPIKAYAEKFKNLSILHFDAHTDRRPAYEGNKYSHASIIARVEEMVNNVVSVGIRSIDTSEMPFKKNKIFFAEDIVGKTDWMKRVVKELSGTVYVTIDLDVFDPAFLPSTGTPEPGGMDWYTVIKLLKLVAEKTNVVGLDVVELAPNPTERSSDFLAAKLVYKILSYKFIK